MPANHNRPITVGSKWRHKQHHRERTFEVTRHRAGLVLFRRVQTDALGGNNFGSGSTAWFLANYEPIDTDEETALAAVVDGKVD